MIMMENKLYLLLAILFVVIICSASTEQKPRKDNSASDLKKKVVVQDKNDARDRDRDRDEHEDEGDMIDDRHTPRASYAHNRYSSFDAPEGNYRTRSRWPASSSPVQSQPLVTLPSAYEDFMDENDWSPFGYGNAFPSQLPSASFDSNPMLSSGPTCHSLVDQQYPIFSDTCGAVPQARYSLPNSFGHRERWQIAQILTTLMSSSTDSTCTRSLRLLLCPVLFPPCPTRHEPPPVLPCQSYCRAVKARCSIPMLDLLPCEVLPYSSDLCPTNQRYGSFIPPGAFPSQNQQLSMTGPSSNYPPSRSFPSLQSLLSSQGLQAALSGQGFQSPLSMQGFQSELTPQNFQSGFQPSSPSAFTSGPSQSFSNLYNGGPFSTESLNPMFVDFPPRSYGNDYRQGSRYAPLTRSSSETRYPTETRYQTATNPAAVSSVVKA